MIYDVEGFNLLKKIRIEPPKDIAKILEKKKGEGIINNRFKFLLQLDCL